MTIYTGTAVALRFCQLFPFVALQPAALLVVRVREVVAPQLALAYMFMPHIVMTYIIRAYIRMAYIFMVHIVMTYKVGAYVVVAHIDMAYVVIAYSCRPSASSVDGCTGTRSRATSARSGIYSYGLYSYGLHS